MWSCFIFFSAVYTSEANKEEYIPVKGYILEWQGNDNHFTDNGLLIKKFGTDIYICIYYRSITSIRFDQYGVDR